MIKQKLFIVVSILVAVVFLVFVGLYLWAGLSRRIKSVLTLDTMGQIAVTLGHTPIGQGPNDVDLATEARKKFPTIPVEDGRIIDAWGRAITVSSKKVWNGWEMTTVSCGPDGVLGTTDDLVREGLLSDDLGIGAVGESNTTSEINPPTNP